ncbi:MAG: NAD(+) diphosphatase [Spirochaetia bacterium]
MDSSGKPAGPSLWLVCRGSAILVSQTDGALRVPFTDNLGSLGLASDCSHVLGTAHGCVCRAAGIPVGTPAPKGFSFEGLRSLADGISYAFFAVAARALEVVEWDLSHRFCGTCGSSTVLRDGERARECSVCGSLSYPRISPAVIVAVVRDTKILLARAARFPPGLRSVLAGYVEPGETLEECVHREVREETGIEVQNLRYFASQPWPFPHSLMIAFTAEHSGGEIVVDGVELKEADWYTADALPQIPGPMTVARKLIDWFCTRSSPGELQ